MLVRPATSTASKGAINFLLNKLNLGDFSAEHTVEAQDMASNCVANKFLRPPKLYTEAMKQPDIMACQQAIKQEIENMKNHAVFEISPLPANTKPIRGGWVFLKNRHQEPVKPDTLLLTVAVHLKWHTSSFDFIATYLNAEIDKEQWIRPPEGMVVPKGLDCKLKKALYGTHQEGCGWWTHLRKSLETHRYSLSSYDTSVFFNKSTNIIIWLHVDDGVVFGKNKEYIENLHLSLATEFGVKWSHELDSIVGLNIQRDAHGFHISQVRLIKSILTNHWDQKADYYSPLPVKCDFLTLPVQDETIQQHDVISAVGTLSYVVTVTGPNLAYAVSLLERYSMRPGVFHWRGLQHVLGYLNKTQHYCLSLTPDPGKLELKVYSDASWGGEFSRSAHRYITTFLGCPISWCAKRLATVASSSCHAEFMALATAARHGQWLQHLLLEVLSLKFTIQLRCDNASCIKITKDCSSNKCTRHSDRDFFPPTNYCTMDQLPYIGSLHFIFYTLKDGLRFEGCSTEESLDSVAYVWQTSFSVGEYGGRSVFVYAGRQAPALTSIRTDINPADPIQCMWGNSSKEPNLVRPAKPPNFSFIAHDIKFYSTSLN
ncbi:hypothetical protein O181_026756 [Austropuccinia psidii MF-1]|uniref:Reverse transcriptase Ty1/copia-type domain-containing protein n=1 Tax=Austropuccinia psidii MF-1 TaxID=1389203 RepID=A0A9Q3CR38_9BASI|nr:hypothetical protein [Austropuccinia psidii MF-1]